MTKYLEKKLSELGSLSYSLYETFKYLKKNTKILEENKDNFISLEQEGTSQVFLNPEFIKCSWESKENHSSKQNKLLSGEKNCQQRKHNWHFLGGKNWNAYGREKTV